MSVAAEYARTAIEALPVEHRRQRLDSLAAELTRRLSRFKDWNNYWRESAVIIDDLRGVGHDLWRHDFDGEALELWGWDYKGQEGAGLLQLQFHFGGGVKTFWRTDNPLLGVDADPEGTEE